MDMSRNEDRRVLEELSNLCVELQKAVTDLNRRMSNMIKPGRVTKVQADKYSHRVAYALDENGQDVTTTDIKWSARAGKIKEWSPPSEGEMVWIISPTGEINETSFTIPGHFNDQFPPNHDKEGEQKLTVDTGEQGGKKSFVLTKSDSQQTSSQTVATNAEHIVDTAGRVDHNKGGELA